MAAPTVTVLSGIILPALQDLGVAGVGRNLSNNDTAVALTALNAMIDAWGADSLTVYTTQRSVWTLNANQQTYQMGPSAVDFVAPRPTEIENAGIILNPLSNPPIEKEIAVTRNVDAYAAIKLKTLPSTFPTFLYYDDQFPNCNLFFWPMPQYAGYQVALYIPQQVTQFATIATTVSLPPGYLEALEFNLALRLAPKFGRTAPATVVVAAKQSLDKIKSRNSDAPLLRIDPALRGSRRGAYNILTDGFGPRG